MNHEMKLTIDGLGDLIDLAQGVPSRPIGEHSLPYIDDEYICITPHQANILRRFFSDLQERIYELEDDAFPDADDDDEDE